MLNEEIDWYNILECSIDSTKEQIEKATRQLSRKYHPDRNKDPKAVQIFLNIQKAKDFLLDDNKRKEYDENIKKKIKRKEYDEKRYKHMDNKRKKMREDLEERLGKFNNNENSENNNNHSSSSSGSNNSTGNGGTNNTSQEYLNQNKFKKKDINDIRQDGINRMNEANAQQETNYHHISEEEILQHRKSMIDSNDKTSNVQIKVKWRRNDVSHSDDSLHSLFRIFGSIEDITMGISGKANTAIITFASYDSANSAVVHYSDSKELRVTLLTNESKKASIFTHTYQNTGTNTGTAKYFTESSTSTSSSSTTSSIESDLMREVRRAVERDELIKQMAATSSSTSSESSTTTSFSTQQFQSFTSTSTIPSQKPPINLVQKENDILARMMAAKLAKSSSTTTPSSSSLTPPASSSTTTTYVSMQAS